MGVLGCRGRVGVCAVLWVSLGMHVQLCVCTSIVSFSFFTFSVYSTTASVPPLERSPQLY